MGASPSGLKKVTVRCEVLLRLTVLADEARPSRGLETGRDQDSNGLIGEGSNVTLANGGEDVSIGFEVGNVANGTADEHD